MARFKKTSARGFVRAVRLTSALRVQADKYESETRHARTDIVGLLKERHRLSLAISINEFAPKEIDDQDAKLIPYPKYILPWKHFPEVSNNFWEILSEECELLDQKAFPSSWECDWSLEGSQHVKSLQDIHTFRHLTVHRYWNELVSDENFWRGSYDSLPDKLVDWDCHPDSGISFKMQRQKDSCLAFLAIGQQEIPLFVIHYVAPQHLPVEAILDGVQNLKDDNRNFSLRGQMQSPFLTSTFECFTEMIGHGLWRGIVDTGVGLIFMKVSKKDPNTLKLHHRVPRDEVRCNKEDNLRHTVVGEYAALVLSSLLDNAPTQQWWTSAMNLDKCRVNSTNIARQLPLNVNLMQCLIDTTNGPTRVVRYYATNPLCTPKCLKGLLRGSRLDPACPNVGDHGDGYHKIDGEQFKDYLQNQLTSQSPQFELQPLHIAGDGNQFLRGTLEVYGYSFLVKAAESHAEERLEAEFDLYERLTPLQGICIPICVGLLDLKASNHELGRNSRRSCFRNIQHSAFGKASGSDSQAVGGDWDAECRLGSVEPCGTPKPNR